MLGCPVPEATARTMTVPWFNDAGGNFNLSTFITIRNTSSQQATVTVTYVSGDGQDVTPQAKTFTIGAGITKSGRPFQVSGIGEGVEAGPPTSMPNSIAPFGSASFSALLPDGALLGDVLRVGMMDQNGDGVFELYAGISLGLSK